VRESGQLVDCAVLVSVGVTLDGKRRVLDVSVCLSEAEVHWRAFPNSLIRRGLKEVKLIVSDDHAGLKAARRAMLPSVPWQRCQFHLQSRTLGLMARAWSSKNPLTQRLRSIFNAPDKVEAERLLRHALGAWKIETPKLARWAEANRPEGFLVFDFPHSQRTRLRTTNGLERISTARSTARSNARSNAASASLRSSPILLPVSGSSSHCSPSATRSG
jgi:transposase-like protein